MNNDNHVLKTYDEIVVTYLGMVKKTIIFEKTHLNRKRKNNQQLYPLLEAAKDKLYDYYTKHLAQKLDKNIDPYLYEFIKKMED